MAGKTVFAMHKYELIEQPSDLLQAQEKGAAEVFLSDESGPRNSNQPLQVKVTMLSQVDFGGEEANTKIYEGLLRQPAIAALKKNVAKFYESWV